MVEVGNFLAKMEIFQERRPSLTRLERVLIVVDPKTLIRGEVLPIADLMEGAEVGSLGILFLLFFGSAQIGMDK